MGENHSDFLLKEDSGMNQIMVIFFVLFALFRGYSSFLREFWSRS